MTTRRSKSQQPITRAVIYARVSKDEAGGRSVREQIASCKGDCEYEGWTVGPVLEDNDRGASRHSKRERENFQKLPDILQSGDVLMVWEPSRVTRNMLEFGPFCDVLADLNVPLYYDGRVYDMNDDDDRNHVWQDILDGAKQAGKTRKRTLRSMSANLDDGKPHGRPAPGYRVVRDQSGKSKGWEVIPEQALVLREAARLAVDGASWKRLARDLEPEWRAAGGTGRFEPEDVKRILSNPTLFGFRVHEKKIVREGTQEPILDPEWFATLRARANSEAPVIRSTEPRWLLTYIARCGVCVEMGEEGLVYFKKAKGTQCGRAYTCRKYNHVQRDMLRVDDHVEEVLAQLLEDPESLAKLTARDEESRHAVDADLALIEQLRSDIKEYIRDAARTRMSADAVAVYVEVWEAQIREAQARVDALTVTVDPVLADAVGPGIRARWQDFTMLRRREIVRAAVSVTIVRVPRRGRYSEVGVVVRPIGALASGVYSG